MEQYFASLSKRQTMLLLTAVTFGGADAVEAFGFLPDEEGELLTHRANGLMQIPREKRIPLLVQEIKRLVTVRRRQLASADPARLAEVLSKERSATVEVILRALPAQIADAVRIELPERAVRLQREVKPDVLSIVRWRLEEALKRSVPKVGAFRFADVLTLQAREVLTICDRMGARALAIAIAGLPDEERDKFLSALPPDQKSLAQRASDAGKSRALAPDDSRTVLEVHGALAEPSTGMRSAGAQRLVRAALAHSPDFAARLVERHQGELGKLLARWLKDEKKREVRGDGGRADIVEQMERLAQRGVLDRPMRLPPPPLKLPAPVPPGPLPGGKLQLPLPRLSAGSPDRRPREAPERRDHEGEELVALPSEVMPRRDFMAEREARKAGAVSARPGGQGALRRPEAPRRSASSSGVPPSDPRVKSTTDPGIKAAKIMRDGKEVQSREHPAVKLDPKTGRPRATTSPALQEIPRRRERKENSGVRSPVVKGGTKGPQR